MIKNQTLEPPDLIQINAILAHDLKKLREDVKKKKNLENQQLEVNRQWLGGIVTKLLFIQKN